MTGADKAEAVTEEQKGWGRLAAAWTWADGFLTSTQFFVPVTVALVVVELVLNFLIVFKVPYTEIDWKAYMQEVEGVLVEHDLDYTHLRGDTGPLVYPAGFVYIYSGLWYLTDEGRNILAGQLMFAVLHVTFLGHIFGILYETKKFPTWALPVVCFSYRIHSIFVLRLFNDCFAMYFLYLGLYYILKRRWNIGLVYYSFAVSIKMNVLLFAPALGLLLVKQFGWRQTVLKLLLFCASVQVVVALPFLATHPISYLSRAFEFTRVFFFKWTVNFRFLPENVFLDQRLSLALLALHLAVLAYFAFFRWTRDEGGLWAVVRGSYAAYKTGKRPELSAEHIVTLMFGANFIGMVFSRSIHYQFYVWYYHTVPYLLWQTSMPPKVKALALVVLPLCLERAYTTYPSTTFSSLLLQAAHLCILAQMVFALRTQAYAPPSKTRKKKKKTL